MGKFVCDGTCAGNELGDCSHRVLHLKTQRGQPYGSERRCCEECGVMIWGAKTPEWTADPGIFREPPPGYRRCTDTEQRSM